MLHVSEQLISLSSGPSSSLAKDRQGPSGPRTWVSSTWLFPDKATGLQADREDGERDRFVLQIHFYRVSAYPSTGYCMHQTGQRAVPLL